jgi:hypothetical protein
MSCVNKQGFLFSDPYLEVLHLESFVGCLLKYYSMAVTHSKTFI